MILFIIIQIIGVLMGFLLILIFTGIFRQKYDKMNGKYDPRVSLIVPCKGSDEEFVSFLKSIDNQKYDKMNFIFTLASSKDPAIEEIKKNITKHRYQICISKRIETASEKMQNLFYALKLVHKDSEVIAFIDSDGILPDNYINNLVQPLQDKKYICSSTYRVYTAKSLGGLVAKYYDLLSLIFKENPLTTYCWGGGFAIRYPDKDKLPLEKIFTSFLTEEMPLNYWIKKNKLKVYSSRSYVQSYSSSKIIDVFDWARRETILDYRYFRINYFYYLFVVLFFIIYELFFLFSNNILYLVPHICIMVIYFILIIRFGSIKEGLYYPFILISAWVILPYIVIFSPFKKEIKWAGITYKIDNKGKVIERTP